MSGVRLSDADGDSRRRCCSVAHILSPPCVRGAVKNCRDDPDFSRLESTAENARERGFHLGGAGAPAHA